MCASFWIACKPKKSGRLQAKNTFFDSKRMARQMESVPFWTFVDRKMNARLRSDSRHFFRFCPRRVCVLCIPVYVTARASRGQFLNEKFPRFEMKFPAFWALVGNQIAADSFPFVVRARLCFINRVVFGERISSARKASRTFSWWRKIHAKPPSLPNPDSGNQDRANANTPHCSGCSGLRSRPAVPACSRNLF